MNKELAIQHFKSKYNCTWKEFHDTSGNLNGNYSEEYVRDIEKNLICILYDNENQSICVDLNHDIKNRNFLTFTTYYDDSFDSNCSLSMLEDLLSIIHLYYLEEKEK